MEKWMVEFSRQTDAVYFASADKKTQMVGFGVQSELLEWPNQNVLNQWLAQQTTPVFGGLNFNQQQTLPGMRGGYFVAPNQVIDLSEAGVWHESEDVTTKPVRILQTVAETDWVFRMNPIVEQLQTDPIKQKVVLGMQDHLTLNHPLQLSQLLMDLRQQQPDSYHFVLKRGNELFVSATPERIIQLKQQTFETAAVAGSTPRGQDAASDTMLAKQLLHDAKNRQEHQIVVDMLAEKLTPLADLSYQNSPQILRTPQIQHLYTPISGKLKAQATIMDLVQRLHPTPALGGWPRDWALQMIVDFEEQPRGLFAAPIGYMAPDGFGEFIVGIRSMYQQNCQLDLFAGAGILADSDLAKEQEEIRLKMTPMRQLIERQTYDR